METSLSREEIINYLNSDGKELFKIADGVRKKTKGQYVHLRGLIEFSSFCKNGCFYCGIRKQNQNAKRYRLDDDEILGFVENGVNLGYKTVVLQSGEDEYYSEDKICSLIEKIKKFDVALTLSIGEKSYKEYKAYKDAGLDRYLIRIETTDEKLYKKMHPNMNFQSRVECLYNLKELGLEVGTGSIVGLPSQTVEALADDILFYKKLNADMVGIGPFIPHPDTPLKGEIQYKNFEFALKMMAITRIMLPDINIPATTAMETIDKDGRIKALQAGANVVMPNITNSTYRKKYELYPNKICINEDANKCRFCIEKKIEAIGRKISLSKGYRYDKN